MIPRRTILAASLLPAAAPAWTQAPRKLHVAQATPAVSFLPLQAARAFGAFPAAGLDLYWAALPGGDPACLSALDRGNVECAAVGSATLLAAISEGRPFQMVASLMGKVSLELVASNALIETSGLAMAGEPPGKRLALLKGATVGVSAAGGTQDRALRWLARQAGLDPQRDLRVVVARPPIGLRAALEAGTIDAFVMSPPEGLLAEDAGIGQVVLRMDEFPRLKHLPSLVLAVRTPVPADTKALLAAACQAMQSASDALLADPAGAAATIQDKLFPRLKTSVVAAAIARLASGVAGSGRFDPAGIAALRTYAGDAAAGLDLGEDGFWTNEYWDDASK